MSMVDITSNERRIADRVDTAITNNLAISDQAGGVQFANAGEVMEWAKMMSVANSGVRKHLRGNPGACLAICVQAVEWGMSSFAVANKSYFVNDQIAFESQLIQAVILKRAPIKGRIKFEFTGEGANRVCRAWARLRDEPDEIVEYVSPLFKDIQPKNSPLWKNDPDQQHCYMAGRALCRRHFPDVILGVYTEDEIMPAIGADRAQDVTPSRSLHGKLDVLAAAPATRRRTAIDERAEEDSEVAVDSGSGSKAATGEDDQSSSAQDTSDAGRDDDGRLTPREELIHDLRGAIMGGQSALKLLNGLDPGQAALLTDQDRKDLRDAWRAFEKDGAS